MLPEVSVIIKPAGNLYDNPIEGAARYRYGLSSVFFLPKKIKGRANGPNKIPMINQNCLLQPLLAAR